jgi:hypothetical protein
MIRNTFERGRSLGRQSGAVRRQYPSSGSRQHGDSRGDDDVTWLRLLVQQAITAWTQHTAGAWWGIL